ncbi:MAG: amidohydrolase [Streptosporangiaceae bacterium]|jgi:predicted TIM-barrel fold metal-dependent hydrolase|nr:amidohydrolase [Streptosporangiaceae bacterium]
MTAVELRELRLRDYTPRSQARAEVTEVPAAAIPCIDVHNHLGRWLSLDGDWPIADVSALVAAMDECRVEAIVNLDGRWGGELGDNLDRYDTAYPGRFYTFCQLDWRALAEPDGVPRLVRELREAASRGARGLKVWKDLGLHHRDGNGELVLPGDPRLAPIWQACAELRLPVLIHSADPVAFFEPLGPSNERLEELIEHPDWWFGDTGRFPTFGRLIDSLETLVAAHPGTTFVGAHVGCNAEDLRWVDRMLTAYPNFHVDLGARMAELGRRPRATRALILRHPEQVLFGTDAFPPASEDYRLWFRFLESADEAFSYAPDADIPPQGRWHVQALDLPPAVLPHLYAANARRVLGL